MSKDGIKLNIVNEEGEVIGEATREEIHTKGLLHREVHVWLYTTKCELIFQHREKDKETYPDLLDASVGGHVEIGENFETAALKELEEETGIKTGSDELQFVQMMKNKSHDSVTGKINYALRAVYALRYDGNIKDLKLEKGKSQGFELWKIESLFNISEKDKKRFISTLFSNKDFQRIFREIGKLCKSQ